MISQIPIDLLGSATVPAKSARNLGVIFDAGFSIHNHAVQLCKFCFFYMRDLRRIRKHLTLATATALANALVTRRLDYCNSLLTGISAKDLLRLQRIQNCLARIVTKSPRFSSSQPLLKLLHWLPIRHRINFNLGLLTFKTLKYKEPLYLFNMLIPLENSRNL